MASPAGTGICRLIVTNFIHGGDVDDDCDANLMLIKITCSFEVFQQSEEYQAGLDVARLGPKTLR